MQIKRWIHNKKSYTINSLFRVIYLILEFLFRQTYGGMLLLYSYFFFEKKDIHKNKDFPFFMEMIPFFRLPFSGYMARTGSCVWASLNSDKLVMFYFFNQRFRVQMEGETICFENETRIERYVVVSAVNHDPILKKYHFDSGLQYYILHFSEGDLIQLGGIKRGETAPFWYQKEEFLSEGFKRKPRILQLPIIALYAPSKYTKGLRELGYTADYLIVNDDGFRWLLDGEKPDFDLEATKPNHVHRMIEALIYGLKNYDIFHIHSNCSFLFGPRAGWEGNSDISYLRQMGKFVISSTWGMCDATKYMDELRLASWHSECRICKQLRPIRCESILYGKCIERSEKNAYLRLSNGRALIAYPDHKWLDNPIDIDVYTPTLKECVPEKHYLPKTTAIRIYHSFGNATKRDDVKGSKFIKAAVERLQQEGVEVEFIYFHNLPHVDIKYYQAQADIVVEQLYAGWYGSTGTECLALGKPVITYVNPDVEMFLRNMEREIPVISATPDTIYDVLKSLIDCPEIREEWGRKARKYAENYHDYSKVAKVLAGYYEEVLLERGVA